ncbi:MAG: acyl-CoA dehydrogenase family protein [Hyphomicrobiaceae bacterium]
MADAEALEGLNFELPSELAQLKEQVRRFVDKEMIPIERYVRTNCWKDPSLIDDLREKAKVLGLESYDVPVEYGGLGFGLLAKVIVWSEMARTIALPSRAVSILGNPVSPILYNLNEEQKKKYLEPTLRREIKWSFAQTEPDAGGDPSGMRTRAVREGDHYIINGRKRFITQANEADYLQLIALTDPEKKSRGGISAFIVSTKAPGVKLLREQELMIDDRPWEIAFDNVKVPVSDRIGEEGAGFKHAQHWISVGRVRHASRAMGVIERCLELGATYAKQRSTFGRPLADRQAVQWMLVDSFSDLHMLRLMAYHAAWKYDRGEDIRVEAYMAKNFGNLQSTLAADRCMQIHGGTGMSTDLPIETFWRDQRSMQITEGPTEILKMAIARHVLATYGG